MMDVNITNYGTLEKNRNFIVYTVSNLDDRSLKYLSENLEDEHTVEDGKLVITMYFTDKYYPFISDLAHYRFDDFKAREEIEMLVYLSGFLEDIL
ncbi:MAG: DUF5750 family protein [Methanobrevibacter boviskoreani]|jgi:hypothetical protein|uniref:DUF5750 family protein n=1 Tax=Methanobrevibacter TaxID=2172 RepID=UPI0003348F4E|nr:MULTISPECIES: DUF5750 family protein [Methanobrevibacter]AGN17247.1 hypothetical protein Abm4_1370 [Methanobrevibacter sp. AbM4]MCI6774617.1 hypothetical protein [Methanobrevibacter boviskoreani]MDD6256950.1 hypothetical protein [Methanobrevibacter boviskoreani]MDY5614133.1 DUF5750 family protein [Methanobrevibacter boviskoreani]